MAAIIDMEPQPGCRLSVQRVQRKHAGVEGCQDSRVCARVITPTRSHTRGSNQCRCQRADKLLQLPHTHTHDCTGMDPLSARIEVIGGRPYRVFDPVDTSSEPKRPRIVPELEAASAPAADVPPEDEEEPIPELDDELIVKDGDLVKTTFSCDSALFPYLIGKGGATKERIQAETNAVLTFPKRDFVSGQQDPDVSVQGPDKASLSAAVWQMQRIVTATLSKQGVGSPDYNYFISVPLALTAQSPELMIKVHKFREAAQAAYTGTNPPSLDPSLFNRPESMHLTVCMLKLYSEQHRLKARQTLTGLRQQIVNEVLSGQPLKIKLQGLETMNGNAAATNVVYAKVVDKTGQLQKLCDVVVSAYKEAGLLLPQDDRPTKLHATLINTRYLKGPARPEGRFTLDVRSVLKACSTLDLGQLTLNTLHLSQRHVFDPDTGYYNCAAALDLPV